MKKNYLILIVAFVSTALHASNIVVVDKAKYQLHLGRYEDGVTLFKTYPVTIGKSSGDKMLEGDLKSPEGIYVFTHKLVPPQIKKKFGAMAFYVNYPNLIDRMEKKTGFDIMLHSTDDPARLARPQDSDGCFVVNDERIAEIDPYIVSGDTILLVYDELKEEYLKPIGTEKMRDLFNRWLKAWTQKDIDAYIAFYADGFSSKQMNKAQYKNYKEALNRKYDKIKVNVSNVKYFTHPKYSVIHYTQEYQATLKNGRTAFNVKSNKTLYLRPDGESLKIISEGN